LNQPLPGGADGHPDRHLALAPGGRSQQQVGDVGGAISNTK
jgi:hypothetical protein